jgi:hypothetical protein
VGYLIKEADPNIQDNNKNTPSYLAKEKLTQHQESDDLKCSRYFKSTDTIS